MDTPELTRPIAKALGLIRSGNSSNSGNSGSTSRRAAGRASPNPENRVVDGLKRLIVQTSADDNGSAELAVLRHGFEVRVSVWVMCVLACVLKNFPSDDFPVQDPANDAKLYFTRRTSSL